MPETTYDYRRAAMEAAVGIDAINRFAEIQLQWADNNEAEYETTAAEIRESWCDLLVTLNGFPREQLACELFDMFSPILVEDEH